MLTQQKTKGLRFDKLRGNYTHFCKEKCEEDITFPRRSIEKVLLKNSETWIPYKDLRASLSRITGEDQLVTKGFVIPSTKWQFLGEINNQPNIKIPLYLDSSNGNNMLDISPWQTWSTKRTTLVNDSIISNSRIPIKTSPNSTQKSQSHDKRPG